MYDMSWCGTFCDQQDCERNLRFNKPKEKYYSVSNLDSEHTDHKTCPYKIKKKGV